MTAKKKLNVSIIFKKSCTCYTLKTKKKKKKHWKKPEDLNKWKYISCSWI